MLSLFLSVTGIPGLHAARASLAEIVSDRLGENTGKRKGTGGTRVRRLSNEALLKESSYCSCYLELRKIIYMSRFYYSFLPQLDPIRQ